MFVLNDELNDRLLTVIEYYRTPMGHDGGSFVMPVDAVEFMRSRGIISFLFEGISISNHSYVNRNNQYMMLMGENLMNSCKWKVGDTLTIDINRSTNTLNFIKI